MTRPDRRCDQPRSLRRQACFLDWLTGAEICEDRETTATSVSDDGQVITGESRLLRAGVADGAIYTPKMGWMLLGDFLESQGVLEASLVDPRRQGVRVWKDAHRHGAPTGCGLLPRLPPRPRPGVHLPQAGRPPEDHVGWLPPRNGCSPVARRFGRVLCREGSALSGPVASIASAICLARSWAPPVMSATLAYRPLPSRTGSISSTTGRCTAFRVTSAVLGPSGRWFSA